jgi:hypothetical protein
MPKRIAAITGISLSGLVTLLAWLMFAQGHGPFVTALAALSTLGTAYLLVLDLGKVRMKRKYLCAGLAAVGQVLVVAFFVLRVWVLPNEEMNRLRRQILVDRNPTATQHIYLFAPSGTLLLHDEVQGKVTRAWSDKDKSHDRNPDTGSFIYYFTRHGEFRQTNTLYILSSHSLKLDPVLRVEQSERAKPRTEAADPGRADR